MSINITVIQNRSYVWNPQDASELREKHRICGALVGSLPRAPRQNVQLGLPLQLLPEEATLIIEKGVARAIKSTITLPSPEVVEEFKKLRKQSYLEQVDIAREQRVNAVLRHKEEIIEGRKRKLALEDGTSTAGGEQVERDIKQRCSGVDDLRKSDLEFTPLSESSTLIQIALETPPPLQSTTECETEWTYPDTDQEKLRYRVFKDLWEQGYYLTNGGKFGGDFLVYPGDPLRFHSMFIARCVPYREDMNPLDIVSMGRLASNVKKTLLLCALKDDKLFYTSLQWTGMS